MLENALIHLKHVPFWAWVIIPAVIIAVITFYASNHNKKLTFMVLFVTLFGAWAAAGFHFWEVYLHEHVIAEYDEYGIPINFSDSGWHLLIQAWPFWLLPVVFTFVVVFAAQFYIAQVLIPKFSRKTQVRKKHKTTTSAHHVTMKLEIEKLRDELEKAEQQLEEDEGGSKKKRKTTRKKSKEESSKIKELEDKVASQDEELERAKILIEKLLERRLDEM